MIPPEQLPRGAPSPSSTPVAAEVLAATPVEAGQSLSDLGLSEQQWSGLCAYLEGQLDQARAETARALHDELGGLLVATKMDLSHLQHSVRGQEPELRERLSRAQLSLDAVVATERRVVEDLQPGLLMHIGLFAALRWYVDHLNSEGRGSFEADIGPDEPFVGVRERVALYRAVQMALQMCGAAGGRLVAAEHRGTVSLTVAPLPAAAVLEDAPDVRLLAIRHRVAGAGGTLTTKGVARGASLTIRLPVSR
jgi:signal transduction histidine kinase